jgi:UDP-glucose:(heptosyl)LPS alpha-1,3-glucosyltransferase
MMANNVSSWFLPVSSIAMESFHREYATLPGHWQVVHPGVDVARFSTPDRDACRSEIRVRYNIGPSDFLILFVGMNFEVKGLDTIIAAVAKAVTMRPEANIRLLVVGRGDEIKFGKIARYLGIGDSVIFAGSQANGIERYYRAADLFIMLSAFDTFGMVVLEAMAAGLPVIVSPNVGAKDLVEDGGNGFVLNEVRNADPAAERIVRMLDDDRRNHMGKAAVETASAHDWDRLADRMAAVFNEALSKKGVA